MTPFTRHIDPALARFLASTSRGVAVVAAIFCVAVATLLVANWVQIVTLKPLDSPALTALREQYRAAPNDDELAQRIRALDLAARRTYFTRQWQTRTAGWMLAVGAGVLLVSIRALGSLTRRLPQPASGSPEASRGHVSGDLRGSPPGSTPRGARIVLAGFAVLLLAGGLSASVLTGRWLGAGERGGAPAAARAGEPGAGGPQRAGAATAAAVGPDLLANWPQLRGPGGNGVAGPQDPPVDWDGASGRNILWKVEVPLPGRNSPVVWKNRVFLSGADSTTRTVYCWDANTGAHVWHADIPRSTGAGAVDDRRISPDTGWAASTMAVNGKAVFAVFATGDLVALDFDGKILWSRNLAVPDLNYGYASSLALYGDSLVVQLDQVEGGRLLAVDAGTGRDRWQVVRQVTSSWSSPVVVDTDQGPRIFANGTPVLAAYDPASKGRKLWDLSGMMGENAPSPAFAGGRVFAANQLLSMVAADARTGEKLWEVYDNLPDVASPLAFEGFVVMTASYGVVTSLDAKSGAVLARQEFPKGFWASPILAGGRIYALDLAGTMRIFVADGTLKLLASPAIGEPTVATPAFRDGDIFIRGDRHLFCIRGGRG